eukprot:364482-Chlamydomonas_euryale.AAC.7
MALAMASALALTMAAATIALCRQTKCTGMCTGCVDSVCERGVGQPAHLPLLLAHLLLCQPDAPPRMLQLLTQNGVLRAA